MPTENRSNDADGWIACDDGLHLIQMDKNLSHYGWVFRKVGGGRPYSVREATPHEMAHAQARQHLRIGVAQIAAQAPAPQPHPEPMAWMVGTAFWWTKEEAERDAAATGLPIVGVGPMTGIAPAERYQVEPVACSHEWTDDGEFLLVCTKCGAQENHDPKWRDMATAPRDGTLVRLLVEFTEHATEDSDAMPSPTIGANSFDHTGDDVWQFAGWSWEQDCFTQGAGEPVGWLPMLETPSEEPATPVAIDHDALVAAVCVLRSQGLGNLSEAVEIARDALERNRS